MAAIGKQPKPLTVKEGKTAKFSVEATGVSTYLWHKNGNPIQDATGQSYEIASVKPEHEGDYTVVVTDQTGGADVTSSVAKLTVTPKPAAAGSTNPAPPPPPPPPTNPAPAAKGSKFWSNAAGLAIVAGVVLVLHLTFPGQDLKGVSDGLQEVKSEVKSSSDKVGDKLDALPDRLAEKLVGKTASGSPTSSTGDGATERKGADHPPIESYFTPPTPPTPVQIASKTRVWTVNDEHALRERVSGIPFPITKGSFLILLREEGDGNYRMRYVPWRGKSEGYELAAGQEVLVPADQLSTFAKESATNPF